MSSRSELVPQESSSPTNTTASSDSFDRALAKAPGHKVVSPTNSHVVNIQRLDFQFTTKSPAISTRSNRRSKAAHGIMEYEHQGVINLDTSQADNANTGQASNPPWHGPTYNRSTKTPALKALLRYPLVLLLAAVLCFAINLVAAIATSTMLAHETDRTHDFGKSGTLSVPLQAWLGLSVSLFVVSCAYLRYAFVKGRKGRRYINPEEDAIGEIGQFRAGSNTLTIIGTGQILPLTPTVSNRTSTANNSIEVRSGFGVQMSSHAATQSPAPQHNPNSLLRPESKQQVVPRPSQTSLNSYSLSSSSDNASLVTASEGNGATNLQQFGPRTSSINALYPTIENVNAKSSGHAAYAGSDNMTSDGQTLSLHSTPSKAFQRPTSGLRSRRSVSFTSNGADTYVRPRFRPSIVTMSSADTVRPKTAGYFSGVDSLASGSDYSNTGLRVATGLQQATAVQILSPGKARSLQLNRLTKEGNPHRLSRSVGEIDQLAEALKEDEPARTATAMKERDEKDPEKGSVHVQIIPPTPEQQASQTTARRPDSCPPTSPRICPSSPTGAVWGTPCPPGEKGWSSPTLSATDSNHTPHNSVSGLLSGETPAEIPYPRASALQSRSYETRSSWLARLPRSSSLAGRGLRKPSRDAYERLSHEKDLPPLPLGSHPPTPPRPRKAKPVAEHDDSVDQAVLPPPPPPLLVRPSPLDISMARSNALNIRSASETDLPVPPMTPATEPLPALAGAPGSSPTKRGSPVRSVSDDEVATRGSGRRVRRSSLTDSVGLSRSAKIDVGGWLVYAKGLGL